MGNRQTKRLSVVVAVATGAVLVSGLAAAAFDAPASVSQTKTFVDRQVGNATQSMGGAKQFVHDTTKPVVDDTKAFADQQIDAAKQTVADANAFVDRKVSNAT